MSIRDLIPFKRNRAVSTETRNPFLSLQREMNSLFDDFFKDFDLDLPGALPEWTEGVTPRINVSETDKEVKVSAELPGMSEKDIDVTLEKDALILKGEKKAEEEHKEGDTHYVERSFGSVYRRVQLPCEVDPEKTDAQFKNGVLNVTLPKTGQSSRKKITVKK